MTKLLYEARAKYHENELYQVYGTLPKAVERQHQKPLLQYTILSRFYQLNKHGRTSAYIRHVELDTCGIHGAEIFYGPVVFEGVDFKSCEIPLDEEYGGAVFIDCTFENCTFMFPEREYYYEGHTKSIPMSKYRFHNCTFDGDKDLLVWGQPYGSPYYNSRINKLPETGSVIGWKKVYGCTLEWFRMNNRLSYDFNVIVQLEIPAHARRYPSANQFSPKCRASSAKVLGFYSQGGAEFTVPENIIAYSREDHNFRYRIGEMVYPRHRRFDTDRSEECTSGIHFFVDRDEACRYFI